MNDLRDFMSDDQMKETIEVILSMESMGIVIDNVKEIDNVMVYYLSVPESSTLEVSHPELNKDVKTSNGLIDIAKTALTELLVKSIKEDFDDEQDEMKKYASEHIKFYAKIRQGDIWSKEKSTERINKIMEDIEKAKYQPV